MHPKHQKANLVVVSHLIIQIINSCLPQCPRTKVEFCRLQQFHPWISLKIELSMSQATDEEDDHYLLVAGYIHEVENENSHILIPHEILIIISLFCPKQYEVLQFDEKYKSKQVIISDDGKCAKKDKQGNFWVLSGGDAVRTGIAVWRIKVWYITNYNYHIQMI